jgi:hypothetical protein
MLLTGKDHRMEAEFVFPENPDRAIRVAVLTCTETGNLLRGYGRIDKDLNELVSRRLDEGFLAEKESDKIHIVMASHVAKWQDEHPNWRDLSPAEIGKALKADYVILLEVDNLSFFDGGDRQLLHGRADITVSVIDVTQGDGDPVKPPTILHSEYPKDRPIYNPVPFTNFRRDFLKRMAEQVSNHFLPHEIVHEISSDPF